MTLPVSLPLGGALALVLAVGIAAFAGGIWMGTDLQAGRSAIGERADLRRQIESLDAASLELRRRGLAVAQDFRTAQIRFETTAEGLSDDLASLDATFAAARDDIEGLLALHPEWGDCRIGPDGVHAWNAAAAGARLASAAATLDTQGLGHAMPGNTADPDGRQPAEPDAQLPERGTAVPPLPLPDVAIDGGAGRL